MFCTWQKLITRGPGSPSDRKLYFLFCPIYSLFSVFILPPVGTHSFIINGCLGSPTSVWKNIWDCSLCILIYILNYCVVYNFVSYFLCNWLLHIKHLYYSRSWSGSPGHTRALLIKCVGFKNCYEKKRSKRQRRKGKIYLFECRVPKNSKDR